MDEVREWSPETEKSLGIRSEQLGPAVLEAIPLQAS